MTKTFALPLAAFVGALLWVSPAVADPQYDQCVDKTSTNVEWSRCGTAYLKRLDEALNIAWRKAVSSLDDKQSRAEFLREQQAWIEFKDASCRFYANGSFGREGQVLHYVGCRAAIIEARISDLNAVYGLTSQESH